MKTVGVPNLACPLQFGHPCLRALCTLMGEILPSLVQRVAVPLTMGSPVNKYRWHAGLCARLQAGHRRQIECTNRPGPCLSRAHVLMKKMRVIR